MQKVVQSIWLKAFPWKARELRGGALNQKRQDLFDMDSKVNIVKVAHGAMKGDRKNEKI